ncbi:MAG TPA: MerR family transcriptional regulator [Acidimicrobiales bacterium]|jgi:DNA-binding transcriptional MerR regulator|nr:MerR family transcriptional regulator [Acidimicrobiales bacterium]
MSVNQGFMRIGEVHAQLRKLFPEVELSKIRYYEDKGLVQPSRSRKGYRLYSERDVECLREAIRLAQEEFVPLRVVRLRLIEQGLLVPPTVTSSTRQIAREAAPSAVSVPAPAPTARPVLSVVSDEGAESSAPVKEYFSTSELLATTGLEPDEFNQLQSMGLVTPVVVDGETLYSALDVRVAAHARALLSRGVDSRLLGSLRRVAEREVGVVDDLTSPLRQGGQELSRDEVRVITTDVAREVAALRGVLVERELLIYLRD